MYVHLKFVSNYFDDAKQHNLVTKSRRERWIWAGYLILDRGAP